MVGTHVTFSQRRTAEKDRRGYRMAPPSFAADIKPLFRERDRRAMTFMFDLWVYEDVRANAQAILSATETGDMPCDGAWSDDQVRQLRRWVETGCEP
jgi:hypothetical protein